MLMRRSKKLIEYPIQEEMIITEDMIEQFQHCQVSAAPVRDSAGRIIGSVSVVHDITNRILLDAKIISVADVVEAIFSRRPYRPAKSINAALEEIEKNIEGS